jgi:hypothetical protein
LKSIPKPEIWKAVTIIGVTSAKPQVIKYPALGTPAGGVNKENRVVRRVFGFVSAGGFIAFALIGMLVVTAGAQSSKPVTAQTLMSKLK